MMISKIYRERIEWTWTGFADDGDDKGSDAALLSGSLSGSFTVDADNGSSERGFDTTFGVDSKVF